MTFGRGRVKEVSVAHTFRCFEKAPRFRQCSNGSGEFAGSSPVGSATFFNNLAPCDKVLIAAVPQIVSLAFFLVPER